MNYGDYSPPHTPSPDQQRDALQKGLGRAMQWAMTRRLGDEPLLEACLRDQRFDVQVEDSRGDWLWRLIRAVDAAARFRVPILHALYELSDERSANQLCELACHYAEAGDETFRMRLYEIVEQKPVADSPWLGAEEIILLDGERAFLLAARLRGEELCGRVWQWYDGSLVNCAIERFGEERVNDLLGNTSDRALESYREGWQRHKQAKAEREPQISYREKMRAITVAEIIAAAESNDNRFSGWGRYADDSDLAMVFQHLSGARDAKVIAHLLRVFSNRAVPQFIPRLIEFCQHGNSEVRRRAIYALENIEHPLVRKFALDELEKGGRDGAVTGLFVKNYQQGDEYRIQESIELPEDDWALHGVLLDVTKVLENNEGADCSRLGIIAYALTPCESCRFHAARLLLDQQVAPEWLLEECRFDSSEESRELVEGTRGPETG